jgi:hypothetical protein
MTRVVCRRTTGAVTLACLLLSSGSALAQSDDDRASARAMATQGLAAEEAGQFADAVALFKRAEAIVHAPPHLLHIARSEAKLGRLVAAHEAYFKIAREEIPSTAPRAFLDAQTAAQKEMADLKPRIPTLKIVVEGGTGTVTMDGAPVPDALVGIARPLDPGRHNLQAKGRKLASPAMVVDLAEGAHETVRLVLAPAAGGPDDVAETTAPPPEPAQRGSNVPAYVAWGVGAAGLAVGTAGKRSDAEAICPPGRCPESRRAEVEELDSSADSAATISLIGYGVGIAGVGVGTVLFLLNRKGTSRETARGAVMPWIGAGSVGLNGRF